MVMRNLTLGVSGRRNPAFYIGVRMCQGTFFFILLFTISCVKIADKVLFID